MIKVRSPLYKEKFNFGKVLLAVNIAVGILSTLITVIFAIISMSHQINDIKKSNSAGMDMTPDADNLPASRD